MRSILIALSACLPLAALAMPPAWLLSPYKDVSQDIDPTMPRIASSVDGGVVRPLLESGRLPAGLNALTWAFATGECGHERWGAFDTDAFARLNVADFVRSQTRYIVSTGGEAGIFTCDTDEGMARFVARYDSPMLAGLDFDIEGKQTPAQIDALMRRLRTLQIKRPQLRLSFTLATHAGSDGSLRSLNPLGESVLAAIARAGLRDPLINLMVMNYGPAEPAFCVVRDGRCDMGASAMQAARNVQAKYGIAPERIELTAMLGVNDVVANVFVPDDARSLVRQARGAGLAGVHVWSLDRDRACANGATAVSPRCHSLPGLPALAFTRALVAD